MRMGCSGTGGGRAICDPLDYESFHLKNIHQQLVGNRYNPSRRQSLAHAEQLGGERLAREPDIVFSPKARLSENGSCSTPRFHLSDACVIIPARNAIMMKGEWPW